jgi:hypothetical protein
VKSHSIPEVEEALRARLAAGNPSAVIMTSHEPGALGLTVVRAAIRGAYPGTGVVSVLMDARGITYGTNGEKSLGDLARVRGWLVAPPEAQAFLRLVNDAQFNGAGILTAPDPKSLRSVGGELWFDFERHSFPTNAVDPSRLRIGPNGPPVLESTAPPPPPDDPVADVRWGLEKREAALVLVSLQKLRGRSDPPAIEVLVLATTSPNTMIVTDALRLLRPTPEVAEALKAAWKSLPEERRRTLVTLAEEVFGRAYATTLE